MKKLKNATLVFSLFFLLILGVHSKAGYIILSDALSTSSGKAKSDKYLLGVTIGQTAIGLSSSETYIETAGFCHRGMPPEQPESGKDESHSDQSLPKEFILSQNFPNPFNPVTRINYSLPEYAYVRLVIYNIYGQRVRILVDELQVAGYKTVRWNGRDDLGREMASGVYFYHFEAGRYSSSKKLILLK